MMLNSLNQLIVNSYIIHAQVPVMENLRQTVRMLDQINTSMVKKEELAENHELLLPRMVPGMAVRQPRRNGRQRTTISNTIQWSNAAIYRSNSRYHLPIGDLVISYGVIRKAADRSTPDDYEYGTFIKWELHAAPWLSRRAITTKTMLHIQSADYGLYMTPTITRNLTMSIDLSDSHPVWRCIDDGDILGVQKLLDSGYVRINDRCAGSGMTLLHYICDFEVRNYVLSQHMEIIKMLIDAGADCNSLEFYRMTPLQLCGSTLRRGLGHIYQQLINTGIRLLTDAGGEFYYPDSCQPFFVNTWRIGFEIGRELQGYISR
ncbi:hypothetical protein K440DRAFT_32037 [Wilcoxina mikolae CBS 423.85]|nr:hypothetical protein K440DRAFT_32037 [Wilcoxina mikolae CBS 423.85]